MNNKAAQAYIQTKVGTTDQGQLLLLLYDGALRFLQQAREKMLANKKNIQYLYGQLKNVHAGNDTLQINEAFLTYSGTHWTANKGVLLEFLYLGAAVTDYQFVRIFDSKTNSTELNMNNITPTLSPKDPAFPAWWEEHKSEWEA